MKKGNLVWYGIALGVATAMMQYFQYRLVVLDHATELYIGMIAVFFMALGIWAGRKLTSGRPKNAPPSSPAVPPSPESLLQQYNLSLREYEVLTLIAQGYSNQEIAGRLYISLNTVKTHTSNLFAKLDAQRRTQAVQKAKEIGLLP